MSFVAVQESATESHGTSKSGRKIVMMDGEQS